jgi:hypothetical protein
MPRFRELLAPVEEQENIRETRDSLLAHRSPPARMQAPRLIITTKLSMRPRGRIADVRGRGLAGRWVSGTADMKMPIRTSQDRRAILEFQFPVYAESGAVVNAKSWRLPATAHALISG